MPLPPSVTQLRNERALSGYTVTVNKTDLKVENAIISPWDPVTLPNDGKVDTTL